MGCLQQVATVEYQIATYNGTIDVNCDPNDDNDVVIAKAKAQLKRKVGTFPFGYQSWVVKSRNYSFD